MEIVQNAHGEKLVYITVKFPKRQLQVQRLIEIWNAQQGDSMQMLPCRPFEDFISDFGFGDNNKSSDPTYLDFINVRAAALKSNDGTYRNCPLTFKQGKNSGERPADAEDIITKKKRKTTATALFDDEYAPIAHVPAAAAAAGDARATMFPSPWSDTAALAPAPATMTEPPIADVRSEAQTIAQGFAQAKEIASDNASDMHARFDTMTQGNKALSANTDGKIDKNWEEMQKLIKGLATTLKDGPSSDAGSLSSVHVKLGVQSNLLQKALETMKKNSDEQLAECKTQLNAKIEYGKAEIKSLKDDMAELKLKHAGELKTKDDHCKSLMDAKDVLVTNMTADMAVLKVSHAKLMTDLDDERDVHAAAVVEHGVRLAKQQASIEAGQKIIKDLQCNVKDLQGSIKDLQASLGTAQNDADGKKKSINININTEKYLDKKISRLEQQVEDMETNKQKALEYTKKLETDIAALKKEIRVLSKENAAKDVAKAYLDAANEVLKRDNQYLNVDKAALQKELTTLKAKFDSQTNTITRFSAENMALRGSNLTCENVAKAAIKDAIAAAVKRVSVLEASADANV